MKKALKKETPAKRLLNTQLKTSHSKGGGTASVEIPEGLKSVRDATFSRPDAVAWYDKKYTGNKNIVLSWSHGLQREDDDFLKNLMIDAFMDIHSILDVDPNELLSDYYEIDRATKMEKFGGLFHNGVAATFATKITLGLSFTWRQTEPNRRSLQLMLKHKILSKKTFNEVTKPFLEWLVAAGLESDVEGCSFDVDTICCWDGYNWSKNMTNRARKGMFEFSYFQDHQSALYAHVAGGFPVIFVPLLCRLVPNMKSIVEKNKHNKKLYFKNAASGAWFLTMLQAEEDKTLFRNWMEHPQMESDESEEEDDSDEGVEEEETD